MTSRSIKNDLSRKPRLLPIIAENIPAAMRETPRWLGWWWEAKAGKWTKPPVDIRRNRHGSSTDSATWCDFATALAAAESGLVDGIGFALGDGFCGVDFDNCRDRDTAVIRPDVEAYIRRLGTYGEVSPSGEGVKLILRGTLPKGRRANGNVEVYDCGRFFTVTGHRLDGSCPDLAENDSELTALHRELIEAPVTVNEHRRQTRMDDRELALAALNGLSPVRADAYHDWLLVGMVLHAVDAGLLDAWDRWSRQSEKYATGCCAAKWSSFNGSAVGLGSLIHWAKKDTGWTPPTHAAPRMVATAIAPYQPFPIEVLPEVVGRFVGAASAAIGCDPSFIALPLLGCLARAIGNKRVIRLKRSWQEPAIIWAAIVGKSGTHKSPAIQAAMQCLERKQSEAIAEHVELLVKYEEARAVYDRDYAAWNRSSKNNATELPPWKPKEPICQRYITTDTTMEALVTLLASQFDGVLVARDELAGWLGGIAEYKGGKGSDLGHWLASWSAAPLTVDRKTGPVKMLHVPRAAVSIIGGIQPGVLRTAVGKEHLQDGLCARLLLTMPDPRPVRWSEATVDPHTEAALANVVVRLLALDPAGDENGNPCPLAMPLTDHAKAAWVEYYNRHRAELVGLDDDLGAAWSKLEAYAARFALIFQLCSWAAGEEGATEQVIDECAIRSGIEMADWFGGEARRVYGLFAESEVEREVRELVELVRRKGGAITACELMHSSRRYRPTEMAEAALDDLVRAGYGTWETTLTAGRPRREFRMSLPSPLPEVTESRETEASGYGDGGDGPDLPAAKDEWGDI